MCLEINEDQLTYKYQLRTCTYVRTHTIVLYCVFVREVTLIAIDNFCSVYIMQGATQCLYTV